MRDSDAESTVRWPPAESSGGLIGVLWALVSVVLFGFSLLAFTGKIALPIPRLVSLLILLVFVIAGLACAYLVYGYLTIGYELSAEQLVVRWARQRHVIRLSDIRQILPANERLGDVPEGRQKFWSGYYVGTQPSLYGLVTVVATLKTRRQLLIVAGDRQFAITPDRPVLFLEALTELRSALVSEPIGISEELKPEQLVARTVDAGWSVKQSTGRRAAPPPISPYSPVSPSIYPQPGDVNELPRERERVASTMIEPGLLRDPRAIGLIFGALFLNVMIMVIIMLRYKSLPETLAVHWSVGGTPDRFGPTREIWTIPLVTWIVTIGNLAIAWAVDPLDRFTARFLLASTLIVEAMALIALYMFMH
ncbi:MAG TPA: DUF1648 domain-containing protein [Nitrolancea sp.]|jgi:hypothetical protein|nr:DUF1648 domain-containing protein [Nitrolancea sp.]